MKKKNGFTLVELLAVIVILGVLLLVAIPAVSKVITNSRKGADRDEAIEFLNAITTCTLANGNKQVCSVQETLEYIKSDKVYASYRIIDSNMDDGSIKLQGFSFTGSNGYTVYTDDTWAYQYTIDDLKKRINNTGNNYSDVKASALDRIVYKKGDTAEAYIRVEEATNDNASQAEINRLKQKTLEAVSNKQGYCLND